MREVRRMKRTAAATTLAFMLLAPSASGAGDPGIVALQVGLRQHGFYSGTIDGNLGAGTVNAVRRLQSRRGLAVDGVPGAATRKALGGFGRHARLGGRRSEEHTSELQSLRHLVCRLLLEKQKYR